MNWRESMCVCVRHKGHLLTARTFGTASNRRCVISKLSFGRLDRRKQATPRLPSALHQHRSRPQSIDSVIDRPIGVSSALSNHTLFNDRSIDQSTRSITREASPWCRLGKPVLS